MSVPICYCEKAEFANETREMALAHAVGNEVLEGYRHRDLFAKRRRLMDAWAD